MITVVIPYFQRSAGVLRRALASVAAQRNCPLPIHVIVVDDASPVPPDEEIASAGLPDSIGITLIRQVNGGPGAARNSGLNAVPEPTRFIAFLDSDDEWSAEHLARAVAALEHGFDFYFADHYQLDQSVGAFERGGRIKLSNHEALTGAPKNLFAYSGDLFDQVLRGNVIGTSTVVYRWAALSSLRFRPEFTTAGEDYLFWMAISRHGARATFSTQIEATYGKGVNVYAGSVWGTENHLLRIHQELRYRRAVGQTFSLNAVQKLHIRQEIGRLRMAFARDAIHRLRHLKGFPEGLLLKHAKLDPMALITIPWSLVRILIRR